MFDGTEIHEDSGLVLRQNASADMSLRGNAAITVMQADELRDLDNPSDTRGLPRDRGADRQTESFRGLPGNWKCP